MYSLVALLSLLASASFVLAFLRGRRRHVVLLGAWLVLLLYTHVWGAFLAAAMGLAWLWLWRTGRVRGRDGAWLGVAVLALYAPWIPSLLFQVGHTGAPWAERPSPLLLLAIPAALFGYVALPLLAVAVASAWRRARPDESVRVLVGIAAAAAALAWLGAQAEPAWATRYLAVLLGPLLLALAVLLSRGTRWTALALIGVAVVWVLSGPAPIKSNARTVAADVAPAVRPGDLVVSTQPEQVPVLAGYLPSRLVYLTPLGVVPDPGVVDWRDGLARLRAGRADRVLTPLLGHVEPGRRILLVTPVRMRGHAPWIRTVRARTREWRAALRADPRLRRLERITAPALERLRSTVRAELYEVR